MFKNGSVYPHNERMKIYSCVIKVVDDKIYYLKNPFQAVAHNATTKWLIKEKKN